MTAERRAELRARWTKPPNPVVIELLDALDSATERAERAESDHLTTRKALWNTERDWDDLLSRIATLTRERDALKAELARITDDKAYLAQAHSANEWEERYQIQADKITVLTCCLDAMNQERGRLIVELVAVKRELEAERAARSSDHMLFAKSKAEWETELEAERAGSAAMREALERVTDAAKSYRSDILGLTGQATTDPRNWQLWGKFNHPPKWVGRDQSIEMAALSSTTGAEMLERLKELRDAIGLPATVLDNLSALANGKKPPHEWPYPADCERLRKAEADRNQFADCWAKAETALNDMEIAKNERIATLEANLELAENAWKNNIHLNELRAALEEARMN